MDNRAGMGHVLADYEDVSEATRGIGVYAVPEPTTACVGIAMGALALARRRRRA